LTNRSADADSLKVSDVEIKEAIPTGGLPGAELPNGSSVRLSKKMGRDGRQNTCGEP
jgi:hypothetical protein